MACKTIVWESVGVGWDLFRSRGHQLPSFTVPSPDLQYLVCPGKPQVEAPCDLYLKALHITPAAIPLKISWVPVHTRQRFDTGRNGCLSANVAKAVRWALTAWQPLYCFLIELALPSWAAHRSSQTWLMQVTLVCNVVLPVSSCL